jgi:hypothetical protein
MSVCYITQQEIYNSSIFNDRLDVLLAESSLTLEQDLNFIRSVILDVFGQDKQDPNVKWYKVPFYNLTFIYNSYLQLKSDFEVEHYSTDNDPANHGKHKNVTATGNLDVYGTGIVRQNFTVLTSLSVGTDATITNNINAGGNGNIGLDLSVGRDLNVGRNSSLQGTLTVSGVTNLNNNTNVTGTLSVNGPINGSSTLTITGNINGNSNLNISGDSTINGNLSVLGTSNLNNLNVSNTANFNGNVVMQTNPYIIFNQISSF